MFRTIGAVALATAAVAAHAQAARDAFNPPMSIILQGTFARSSQDPETYRIGGFAPSGGEVGPPRRGFSLAESELVMSGNIDPYFSGSLVAALTPEDELEVEEAFIQTLALGRGFTAKAGRFLSGIGYQNEIHQHAWDFADAPLTYAAFLGGRLNDDGVQVRWVAPTDLFVELGAEAGRGRTFPGSDTPKNGSAASALFGHVGGDLGAAAWRTGLSHLRTSPRERAFDDGFFSGRSRLWIADAVVKWGQSFKIQAEYFRRKESGELTIDPVTDRHESRQSGWYAQAVRQFMPRWRAGYRYDRLDHGEVSGPAPAVDHDPSRSTLMVDWSPTEFSRFRVQVASDKSRAGVTDNQLVLQYVHSLGAHGAHRF